MNVKWGISRGISTGKGSQPLGKSGEILKMSFQFSSQGNLREFGDLEVNTKTQGKLREFGSDPEGKGVHQFGVCASCAMCPSCVH